MGAQYIVSVGPRFVRAARVGPDGQVTDLALDDLLDPSPAGIIFAGKAAGHLPEAGGQIIDLGARGEGLLPARKGATRPTEGSPIVVQAVAAPVPGKRMVVTDRLSYPGVGLVYIPGAGGDGVSRRIADDKQQSDLAERLRALPRPAGGFIARRAAVAMADDLLAAEAALLVGRAAHLTADGAPGEALAETWSAPALDLLGDGLAEADAVHVDDGATRTRLAAQFPGFADRFVFDGPGRAGQKWQESGAAEALEQATGRTVDLASGGSLLIEPVETLTAIDINSGAADRSAVNRGAMAAIARQLRLRNLSGLLAIDLIGHPEGGAAAAVGQALRTAVRDDPRTVRVGSVSRFGLVDLTRERRHAPLHELDLAAA